MCISHEIIVTVELRWRWWLWCNAGKSFTHAFHPPDPEGTCPGWGAPSAQETDPPFSQTKEKNLPLMESRWKHDGEGKMAGKVFFGNLLMLRREVLTWIDQVGKLPHQNCHRQSTPRWCHRDINVMAPNNVILKPWPNFPQRIPLLLHFPHWHEAMNGYYGGPNNQKHTRFPRLARARDNRGV